MSRRPPVHYRQPRAPQAVPAREARYADGFLVGCVALFICGLIVLATIEVVLWLVGL